ncbi:hypothetical protein BpHYR1_045934 [Brachionus plicatilis]|uniref:Uncharacterized protein n=1 Tax=Brachionus plicatilis TaxID=10195 RepID=A0A3M7QAP6_BRAPC|nr:hypothetical protein BpHYR1_045934 [Brachionus plicatilis]
MSRVVEFTDRVLVEEKELIESFLMLLMPVISNGLTEKNIKFIDFKMRFTRKVIKDLIIYLSNINLYKACSFSLLIFKLAILILSFKPNHKIPISLGNDVVAKYYNIIAFKFRLVVRSLFYLTKKIVVFFRSYLIDMVF